MMAHHGLAALLALALGGTPASRDSALVQASIRQTPDYRSAPAPKRLVSDAVDAVAVPHRALRMSEKRALQQNLASVQKDLDNAKLAVASGETRSAAVAGAVVASMQANWVPTQTDDAILGVTPQYAAAIRAASLRLARIGTDDLVALKVLGVTPGYIRNLEKHGLRGLSPEQITAASVHGVDCTFLSSMAAVGYPQLSYKEAVNMRIHGVTAAFVRLLQRRGIRHASAADVVNLRVVGSVDPPADIEVDDDT